MANAAPSELSIDSGYTTWGFVRELYPRLKNPIAFAILSQQTQPTIVAGTLRRAVRRAVFTMILGERHMECAYYLVNGTWNVSTTLTRRQAG